MTDPLVGQRHHVSYKWIAVTAVGVLTSISLGGMFYHLKSKGHTDFDQTQRISVGETERAVIEDQVLHIKEDVSETKEDVKDIKETTNKIDTRQQVFTVDVEIMKSLLKEIKENGK